MIRFQFQVAGEMIMDRAIARFTDSITDYRPIWPVVQDEFYAIERDQFKSEGREGGSAWVELSPEYAGWKEVHYPGKPILERTGDLVRSLTSENDPNSVHVAERKSLTLGTRVPYAIYHQSPAPRKRLPRRPEIVFTEAHKRMIMHHLHTYVVQMASASGFRTGLGPLEASKLGSIFGRGIAPRGTSPRRSTFGGWNF